MTLADLPSMIVERFEQGPAGVRVHGRFDRLEGVRASGKFRVRRGEYVWAEFVITDQEAGAVLFDDSRDRDVTKLRVGTRYTWFDDYWNPPLVEAIADEATRWQRFQFEPSAAQYFLHSGVRGWTKVGATLPEGATPLEVVPEAWDHEHCDLCNDQINAANPIAYRDAEGHFLCDNCYNRYGATHDVSFQLGA